MVRPSLLSTRHRTMGGGEKGEMESAQREGGRGGKIRNNLLHWILGTKFFVTFYRIFVKKSLCIRKVHHQFFFVKFLSEIYLNIKRHFLIIFQFFLDFLTIVIRKAKYVLVFSFFSLVFLNYDLCLWVCE